MSYQGESFIKHEFNEAIAIQEAIVEAERQLSSSHPDPEAQKTLKNGLKVDERQLKELQKFGQKFGAEGEREEIASAMESLMQESAQKATEAESEAYEATAVLLNLKRKQQDAAGAILRIAREMGDAELKTAATEFQKETKGSAEELSTTLAQFAVQIATQGNGKSAQA